MARNDEPLQQPNTLREVLYDIRNDDLKRLSKLVGGTKLTKKADLVEFLIDEILGDKQARKLYEEMPPINQKAVQEATYDSNGMLDEIFLVAMYQDVPVFYDVPETERRSYWYDRQRYSTTLLLFLPGRNPLPKDLQAILKKFVPEPEPFQILAVENLPKTFRQTQIDYAGETTFDLELQERSTELEAGQELKAVLQLVELGKISVTSKKQVPNAASLKAIEGVLPSGDFYVLEDIEDWDLLPGGCAIKAFAWPMIIQAAGFVEPSSGKLKLSEAGRNALSAPAHESLRKAWKRWQSTTLVDEFNRVESVKGQGGRGTLSAVKNRRPPIVETLKECPVGSWVAVDDFFRIMGVRKRDFILAHDPWRLYIADSHYGSLGQDAGWEHMEGRYILAFLFEYAATMGLIDVGFTHPNDARPDFNRLWGTDDLISLSRYDRLLYIRLNQLGAHCLGLTKKYEPPQVVHEKKLKVLANLDIVVTSPPIPPADRLFLERVGNAKSENVWHLDKTKLQGLLEQGFSISDVRKFLVDRSAEAIPATVNQLLDDLEAKASLLSDGGVARILQCKDAMTAQTLAADPTLKKVCQLAGETWLVYQTKDENTVKKALRKLGYVLPPMKD